MAVQISTVRQAQIETILQILAQGECCALFGLSNTGKSLLLRALPFAPQLAAYARYAGRPGVLVYVDCNCVVELTPPGFYEIVVRSLLEAIEDLTPAVPELVEGLRKYHTIITSATTVFQASLAFNNALVDCCERLGRDVVFLFDEFDEVYAALENRALLNLRALKDKFPHQLAYLTATARPLLESRAASADNEFAELFTSHALPLGLLAEADARQIVETLWGGPPPAEMLAKILRLAGGHFGLLTVLTQAALRKLAPAQLAEDANARAECLKIWNQLHGEEQVALKTLCTEMDEGLPLHERERLQVLGLVDGTGQIFSELFVTFVRRQCATPSQTTMGVQVDEDAGEVWVDGLKVTVLTDLEYRLMRLLHQRRDRLTTKDMIVEAVWGGEYLDKVDDARIEKLVSRLRAKVEADPSAPRYLLTQRGRGYKLSSRPVENTEHED